jgi:hypothetical protein
MKTAALLASTALALAGRCGPASAQDIAPPPVALSVEPTAPITAPLTEIGNFKDGEPGYHLYADVGVGCFWLHGGGVSMPNFGRPAVESSAPPLLGPNVSMNLMNDHGWGIGASWWQASQSTTSTWITPDVSAKHR